MPIFTRMKLKLALCYLAVFFFGTITSSYSQIAHPPVAGTSDEGSLVKWMSYAEAMEKYKVQPRPIIMDFYTDWCGWCKRMMSTTYADPNLSSYINAYFYPVKFNAEGKDTIQYLGQTYMPTSNQPRATHPLAVKLLQNKLMYPTTLFLNGFDKTKNEYALNMLAAGYLETPKLEPILVFTLENAYRNSNFDDFSADYQKAFYDSVNVQRATTMKWKTPLEAFGKQAVASKKKLVFIGNNEWCNTCKVQKRSSFADSSNMEYISKTFDLIDFDPTITDTLYYNGVPMYNPSTERVPYHSLAFELCKGSLTFPTMVVMNEKNEVVDVIHNYINSNFMKLVSHFYGDDAYKTKSWQEFTKK